MPLTTLDERTALIVIDLQNGTAEAPTAHPIDEVVERTTALLADFRERRLPVVLASVDGTPPGRTAHGAGGRSFPSPWSDLLPALNRQPSDIAVTRRTWSAFAQTDLHDRLQALGVTQLVLAGIATSFGVESTARQGHDLGYSIVIASDAITDRNPDAHRDSVARVFPALGEVGTTAEVLAARAAL